MSDNIAPKMRYYDNTRISSYKECPRLFFYRHVRHWRRSGSAPALAFGLAWHEAMDVVWGLMQRADMEKVHALACEAFLNKWMAEGFPAEQDMDDETRERLRPRLPSTAAEMLWNYMHFHEKFIKECEILNIERPFAVPLDPNDPTKFYIGRLDKEVRRGSRVIFIEHKTTTAYSKDHGFLLDYQNSWSPNSQIDGYLNAGHILYGNDMKSVYVDAALVHKTHHNIFKFIPVERMISAVAEFVDDANEWVARIEQDKEAFKRGATRGVFPKNTGACFAKYGSCGFLDICKYVANPLEREEVPDGYIIERWSPFETLGLEKIGLPPEEE